jgi:hypothetical protein
MVFRIIRAHEIDTKWVTLDLAATAASALSALFSAVSAI